MKCLNCNKENNPEALFCESCGNKLIQENNVEENNNTQTEQNMQNNINNNNFNQNNITQPQNNKPKKNIWVIVGIIAAIIAVLFIAVFNSDDSTYEPSYQIQNDRVKLENYLTSIGFTKQSSNKYSYYKDGYTYAFDFSEGIFSQEGSSIYNAYYYKKDIFGTAIVSNSLKITATYTYSTYTYNCKAEPATYESYSCNYMKPTVTKLAETIKNTFYTFITNAGISVSNL